jgi:capsular exopolysaccharide synthesis family protein
MRKNHQNLARIPRAEIALPRPLAPESRTPFPHALGLADLWQLLLRRRAPIFGLAAAIFLLTVAYVLIKTPSYEGVARLQVDPTRSDNLGLDDKPVSTDLDTRVKTEVAILQSNTVALQVMQALRLYANPQFAGSDAKAHTDISQLNAAERQRLLDRFTDNLIVKVLPNTQVVEIRFRSPDPALATTVANCLIDQYMQRNFRTRVDGTTQVSQWLSRQMEEIRSSTTTAQQNLAEFQRKHNFLGNDESDNIVTDRLKQLNEQLTQAEADRIVKEGRYRLAQSGDPELIATIVPGNTAQVLRTQQADLHAQYAQLSAKFGSGYPKLKELESQLTRLNSAIESEAANLSMRLANEFDAAMGAERMIRGNFERQKEQAYKLNESVAQYAILKHEVESGQQLYDSLQLKLKEAGITSGLTSSYVSIVDRAQLPDQPIEPRKLLDLALGLAGGLFAGMLLGLTLDSTDDRVLGHEELETAMALPELGAVPFFPRAAKPRRGLKRPNLLSPEARPIAMRQPNCAGAEAYRTLTSVLLLSTVEHPPKIIVVASAMPGEGKSTVSCNLAAALAQRGRKVLLVDADLRCSSIHQQMGMDTSHGSGLSALLTTTATPHPRTQPIADLPNLHVIPAGFHPAQPAEILASAEMKRLIGEWGAQYEHVIIDTPPVLPFADALVLAAHADGVILVTRSGVSRRKALLRARDLLERSGAHLLGFVLNAVRRPEYYYAYPAYAQLPAKPEVQTAASN